MLSDRDEVLKEMKATFASIPDKPIALTDKEKLEITVAALKKGIDFPDCDCSSIFKKALKAIGETK